MAGGNPFVALLKRAPVIRFKGTLVRKVPYGPFAKISPPNFLFTSGKANRYNPRGIDCIYFSETPAIAELEYSRGLTGLPAARAPVITYWAEARLARVLDLTDPVTVEALGLTEKDLSVSWVVATSPTATQLLGEAVARHSAIAAMRYPSEAARDDGSAGTNLVIFRERLVAPDGLSVLGADGKPIPGWP